MRAAWFTYAITADKGNVTPPATVLGRISDAVGTDRTIMNLAALPLTSQLCAGRITRQLRHCARLISHRWAAKGRTDAFFTPSGQFP